MEQLTPEQRIEAYEYVLSRIKEVGNLWICIALASWLSRQKLGIPIKEAINAFPEFMALRPDPLPFEHSSAWWGDSESDRLSRIAALEQCIKECLLLINQPTEQ